MPVEAVINAPTCASIYEVPLVLQQQNVDALIGKALFDTALHADLDERQTLVASALHATREVCIGMVAKYRDETDAYFSVVEALHHATAHENVRLRLERIDASTLEHKDYALQLDTLRKEKGIQ
jgi:CTP synthase